MNLPINSILLTLLGLSGLAHGQNLLGSSNILSSLDLMSQETLSAYGLQCLSGDLAKVATAGNRIEKVIDLLENYCDDQDTLKFKLAFEKFFQCSGYDVASFTETFWSATIGIVMKCAGYYYQISKLLVDFPNRLPEVPLPRVPDECASSLVGQNPFGNFLRHHSTQPENEMECLTELGQNVPACTLRRWPIPIVGEVLKFFACFESKMNEDNIQLCERELRVLSKCLPPLGELENADEQMCQHWIKWCTLDQIEIGSIPSIKMFLPPPFSSAPISDLCKGTDVNAEYKNVPAHFETFQEVCLNNEDLEFWSKTTIKKEGPFNDERNIRSRNLLLDQ